MGWLNYLLVFLGGGLGASTRYWVSGLRLFRDHPYCWTMVINLTGCLAIGVLHTVLVRLGVSHRVSLLVVTGLVGGYTTYATFTLDAVLLAGQGLTARALLYVGVTLAGGVAACVLGLWGSQWVMDACQRTF